MTSLNVFHYDVNLFEFFVFLKLDFKINISEIRHLRRKPSIFERFEYAFFCLFQSCHDYYLVLKFGS